MREEMNNKGLTAPTRHTLTHPPLTSTPLPPHKPQTAWASSSTLTKNATRPDVRKAGTLVTCFGGGCRAPLRSSECMNDKEETPLPPPPRAKKVRGLGGSSLSAAGSGSACAQNGKTMTEGSVGGFVF